MAIHGHPRWLSCCSGFVGALFLCLHLSEQLDTLRFAPVLEAKYIYNIYIYIILRNRALNLTQFFMFNNLPYRLISFLGVAV